MTYTPAQNTGTSVPLNRGWDAWSQRNFPTADKKGAAGSFSRPDGTQINLWVTKIMANFTISGESGQSRMVREFFPRSFNDVTLNITGNVASSREFNRLALFIRESHWSALQQINSGKNIDPTITFDLHDNGPKNRQGKSVWAGARNVKGPHRPMSVTGYVQSIDGGAVRHQIAPEFSIDFIVATSTLTPNTGIWSDVSVPTPTLKTILDLTNTPKTVGQTVTSTIWSAGAALKSLGL